MKINQHARLSIAPMMDWTDRHCRYFHRLMSCNVLLYTEMVTAAALVRGDARHLLAFDPSEHPVAVQLGGADPVELAEAASICAEQGYDEINLNVGCPSDRVQSGCFGAVLMKNPNLVADCLHAMRAASDVEVTVKCRIGVDDQDPRQVLPEFLDRISCAGVNRVTIHARKAWLKGLSPKQNRDVPPLNYALVHAVKQDFPHLHISVNGGIVTLEQARAHLKAGLDGVMIGRCAYHRPGDTILSADRVIFEQNQSLDRLYVVEKMMPYIEKHLSEGGKLHHVTRHMLGLFHGLPGARAWRRVLSEGGNRDGAGIPVLIEALDHVVGGDIKALCENPASPDVA